jgi:hypothetical protein
MYRSSSSQDATKRRVKLSIVTGGKGNTGTTGSFSSKAKGNTHIRPYMYRMRNYKWA